MIDKYSDFYLLEDGSNAFKEIINCINHAQNKIYINMFIWRNDEIGNEIARAVLDAASRGVKVEISKDKYGLVLERVEEAKSSFFHQHETFIEKMKINALRLFYKLPKDELKKNKSDLYDKLMNHPNIIINKDRFKADHSKYYIIDDTLILGGINIEDKENDKDYKGRVYQDYMVKLEGKEYVDSFLYKLNNHLNTSEDYFFGINLKNDKKKIVCEMEDLYLKMIRESRELLIINMAYFSPLKEFIDEIDRAHKRGVKIKIMIPESANFQDDLNKKTVKELMKRTNNEIELYFTPKMAHTKLIVNDDYISVGSTNITKKAFNQLSELNLFVKNENCAFKDDLMDSIDRNYSIAKRIDDYKKIKYSKARAMIERTLV